MEKGDIVLFELYAKDGKEWGDSILLFIQCAWMDILHYLSIINGLKLRNDHLNGPSAKFCMYLDDTLLHNAYKLKGTSSCSFREVGVLWVRQGIFASWCAEWELYESLLNEMINWLLFFPKQTKWTVWVRIVATTLFTLVSVVSGAIIESMNHGCERPLGVLLCEALSAALSPYRRRIDSSVLRCRYVRSLCSPLCYSVEEDRCLHAIHCLLPHSGCICNCPDTFTRRISSMCRWVIRFWS